MRPRAHHDVSLLVGLLDQILFWWDVLMDEGLNLVPVLFAVSAYGNNSAVARTLGEWVLFPPVTRTAPDLVNADVYQ